VQDREISQISDADQNFMLWRGRCRRYECLYDFKTTWFVSCIT